MDEAAVPVFFSLLFPAGLLLFGLFVAVLLFAMRRRPQPGTGMRLTEPRSDGSRGLVGGTWNAMIHGNDLTGALGVTLGAEAGRLELSEGILSFIPADAEVAAWAVPCAQLGVGRGVIGPVRLVGPTWTIHCTVSHERINRFSRNTMKTLREQGYAKEFVAALQAYGAHPA
ncbi:hypothetical protein [Aeromicrobium wangtongii]|uniref:hypothetical protein n=1 Tax=Aeromicrobium wangtongii TaxID=2969247 RepID=UPI0020181F92|nr:hypothetical protein [Aeromicrobium wangtongii]MCL3817630.1 hypothetical protein [Aeromicrobium wangtongii]